MRPCAEGARTRSDADPVARLTPERAGRWLWATFLLFIGLWALAYLWWPFSTDQGILSWVGGVIRAGGLPYRDAWEVRGPFPYFLYALTQLVLGRNQWALRVLDLLWLAAGALAIAAIVRRYAHALGTRGAVALYLLWYASLDHHHTAQSDGWNAVMLAGAVAALLAGSGGPSLTAAAGSGVLLGLCVASKPTYGFFFILPLLVGAAHLRRRGPWWALRFWAVHGLAALAPVALIAGWFAYHGALDELIDVHLRWNVAHKELAGAWLNRIQDAVRYLTMGRFAVALTLALAGLAVVWRAGRVAAVVLAAWAGVAIVTVMLQGGELAYRWLPLYPPLAIMAGVGLDGLYRAWVDWSARQAAAAAPVAARDAVRPGGSAAVVGRIFPVAVAAVLGISAFIEPFMHIYRWGAFATGLHSAERYERAEFGPYGRHTGMFSEVTRHIERRTTEGDAVLVWGGVPGIYYLSGRRSPSRFGLAYPLVQGPDGEFQRRYRDEILARLRAAPPALVVALSESVCWKRPTMAERQAIGMAEGLMYCLHELPELQEFVEGHYAVERTIGTIVVLRRKG